MLYLIGLGFDEKDLTIKAREIAEKCDCYLELYTSLWKGSVENLEKMINKKIKILERSDLEENSQQLLDQARENDTVLFVPGDPLAATTHVELIIQAKKQNIPFKIIHNASIFSAIGETGLQLYKFGRTATIPSDKQLGNVRETLENNQKLGLHTLLLLDIDMNLKNAIEILLENNLISNDQKILAANFGENTQIRYGLSQNLDVNSPAVLIIPGKLHFKEKEFLEML